MRADFCFGTAGTGFPMLYIICCPIVSVLMGMPQSRLKYISARGAGLRRRFCGGYTGSMLRGILLISADSTRVPVVDTVG